MHLWCDGDYGFEADVFDSGDESQLNCVRLKPWNLSVGVLICYDVEFPEASRVLFLKGADIILVPTALACSGPLDEVQVIPRCVIPCRAMENSCFILYSNFPAVDEGVGSTESTRPRLKARTTSIQFCGLSCIVSAEGKDLARATTTSEGLLIASLNLRDRDIISARNPYRLHRLPGFYRELTNEAGINA